MSPFSYRDFLTKICIQMGILTMETGCLQIINQELLLLPVLRQFWLHMVISVHLDALAQPKEDPPP